MEEKEFYMERLQLAWERIREMEVEAPFEEEQPGFTEYFHRMAGFLLLLKDQYDFISNGGFDNAAIEELGRRNHAMYEDLLEYETSFGNPAYAVRLLGNQYGQLFSAVYAELRSLIGYVHELDIEGIVIRLELFIELYTALSGCWQEEHRLSDYEDLHKILYWYVCDYSDIAMEKRVEALVTEGSGFAKKIIMESDLQDLRYLYRYGEYITDSELKMAEFMAGLPEETIATMADTYTEGYRIGFEVTGKDLSIKKIVEIRFKIGFERMVKRAIENFQLMKLQPAMFRTAYSILYHPGIYKTGYYAGEFRQYEYDHKDDKALFLDKNFVHRRLEVTKTAYEKWRIDARGYAGPAVIETFGEADFDPVIKPEALTLDKTQNNLWVELTAKSGDIRREYIIEEERSFTIIAFPVPEIGERFEEIFQEIIKINTLDYSLYQTIQSTLIDALDQARICKIKGMGENHTDLEVALWSLKNPEKETIFENCVADVNIPVGEVFTSPVLKGTNGVLHVTRVFLNGLEYRDLEITFADGMIQGYTCKNFDNEEQNQAFLKESILFRHETLPLGEFAIGTNTTAYVAAKRLQIEDKLPILIAEKMGPHFAIGDTCYSHAEDIKVYNPNGKEIVARDNEASLLRHSEPMKAYFNCHTDITIPYDELGELTAVCEDGRELPIISRGRFVLPGTEALNAPFNS